MKVKLDWLNELVDLSGLTTEDIVNKLSLYSTEIEGVEKILFGTNLTIGHVLTCVDHPDSDHLHVCTVDVGDEVLQIVCGAPNIKAGMNVIVAKVGCELPGDFKIKKSKIRGVESFGMICSLQELGLEKKYVPEEYAEGIYYFVKDVKAGDNPLEKLCFEGDVLELGLTPNRSDLLSMLGVAYEVSAVFEREMKALEYSYTEDGDDNNVNLSVDTDKCSLYYAKVIKDIKIKKSPDWLISRLIAFGIRPINNAVDITNYILALFGQPLHAFDYDKLGNTIKVRNAYDKEEMMTLDNNKRVLETTDIVITDGEKPVAVAGVMGGLGTSVDENTKNILIEAAIFDPQSVRDTYKRLDLRSEAAIRFEKGIDPVRTKLALDYTCYLYQTLCEAKISKGVDVVKQSEPVLKQIQITPEYISKYLGVEISKEEIINICNRLKFEVSYDLVVTVPSRRLDISIKADMVEEIGRIYGYEKLPLTLPKSDIAGKLSKAQKNRKQLRKTAIALGLTEAVNLSLREHNNEFTYLFDKEAQDVELLMPISTERKVLRRNLVNSLLENVAYVFNRKQKNVAFFETGKVYYKKDEEYVEEEHLAIAMSGVLSSTLWQGKLEVVDFFTIKGVLNSVLNSININLDYEKIDVEMNEMHPLRTAKLTYNNKVVGFIGMLHPKYAQVNSLQNVYVAEVNIHDLIRDEKEIKHYVPVSKVPSVERDLAIVVKKDISSGDLVNTIYNVDKKLISDVKVFDLYVGDKIGADEKSLAFKIVFTSNETLTDDVINSKVNKILKQIEKNYNGVLRA